MQYLFEMQDKNYEDFASGRVLYNQKGATSFPVRLASEIFQRCVHHLKKDGAEGPYAIFDPCCGGAYLLTALGFLHGRMISRITASDIDPEMVALAERNLSLLTPSGIEKRIAQIRSMIEGFGKQSHTEALHSAMRLKKLITEGASDIMVSCLSADATKSSGKEKHDVVITDLPYGNLVSWSGHQVSDAAVLALLDNLIPQLSDRSIAAIISDKKTAVRHPQYARIEHFKVGKRQVVLLKKLK